MAAGAVTHISSDLDIELENLNANTTRANILKSSIATMELAGTFAQFEKLPVELQSMIGSKLPSTPPICRAYR